MASVPLRINLIMPTAWVYGAEIARGVLEEAAGLPRWSIHLLRDGLLDRRGLTRWLVANPSEATIVLPRFSGCCLLVAKACPLVVTVCDEDRHDLTRVGIDDEAVGFAAGDHLRARGLRHFAYVRNAEGWSAARERGFRRGCQGAVSTVAASAGAEARERWLAALPKPVGLFAGNDLTASALMDHCTHLGLSLPHEVALLGADDDQLLCLSQRPALSSVKVPWREVGREAARTLVRLFAGERPAHVSVQPLGVAVRPSSDVFSVSDALCARAISCIRAHAQEGINVEDVVRMIGCSRSQLERHLRSALGHGPLVEIRRARVELATQLLTTTTQPISTVARLAGFPSAPAMQAAFHQLLRMTPLAYRTRGRGEGVAQARSG